MFPETRNSEPLMIWLLTQVLITKDAQNEDKGPMTDAEFLATLSVLIVAVIVLIVTIGPFRVV